MARHWMVRLVLLISFAGMVSAAEAQDTAAIDLLIGSWEADVGPGLAFRETYFPDGTAESVRIRDDSERPPVAYRWAYFSSFADASGDQIIVLRINGTHYRLVSFESPDTLASTVGDDDAVPVAMLDPLIYRRVTSDAPLGPMAEAPPSLQDQHQADFLGVWEGVVGDGLVRLQFDRDRRASMIGAPGISEMSWSIEDIRDFEGTEAFAVDLHIAERIFRTAVVVDGPDRLLMTEPRSDLPADLNDQITLTRVPAQIVDDEARAEADWAAWCPHNASTCDLIEAAIWSAGRIDDVSDRTVALTRLAPALTDLGVPMTRIRQVVYHLSQIFGTDELLDSHRYGDLAALAAVQEAVGLSDASAATIRALLEAASPHAEVDVLNAVGLALLLIEGGLDDLGRSQLIEALGAVRQLSDGGEFDTGVTVPLTEFAVRLASLGEADLTFDVIDLIDDERARASALSYVGPILVVQGDMASALRSIDLMQDTPSEREIAILNVLEAAAASGDVESALAARAALGDGDEMVVIRATRFVGIAHAEAGQIGEAERIAATLATDDALSPADAVHRAIAVAYARVGDFESAAASIDLIESPFEADPARSLVADLAVTAGETERALDLIDAIEVMEDLRLLPLGRLAVHQLSDGNETEVWQARLSGILTQAESFEDWADQFAVLRGIAAAFVHAGRPDDAIDILQSAEESLDARSGINWQERVAHRLDIVLAYADLASAGGSN